MQYVLLSGTLWYLGWIILKACTYSLTSTWLCSLSYPLSATVIDIGRISDALMTSVEKLVR